jgi:hypothetical protein
MLEISTRMKWHFYHTLHEGHGTKRVKSGTADTANKM